MPIVTVEFNLPDEEPECRAARQGADVACVLDTFLNKTLRDEIRYEVEVERRMSSGELTPHQAEGWVLAFEHLQAELYELIDDRSIDLS